MSNTSNGITTKQLIVRIAADAVLVTLAGLALIQLAATRKAIDRQRKFASSPVKYSVLVPDKQQYHPGDLISFSYHRFAQLEQDDDLLLLLTIDSFENLNTGEVFPGVQASRIIKKSGDFTARATRRLSLDASPGTYSFEGWLSVQGDVPIRNAPYFSQTFQVVPQQVKPTTERQNQQ